ncbi:MAG: tryptophan--tRNA ligase [Bacteriovoracaceae bacterium]|jgi:tryptophanyl-tRNA synthetase|nr:tryptophan--tRNA ligase [Bacteriovoracaceae bacterium]
MNTIILTGDRPSGSLHIGHYVGSLKDRVKLQEKGEMFVLIADIQAMTDNFDNPKLLKESSYEVLLDYLSVGINPMKSNIFLQSEIPELYELFTYFLNLISIHKLQHNPTIKTELNQKNFKTGLPLGFLAYPISQASDILAFKPTYVPVGADQIPVIEVTNDIVNKFNSIYAAEVFEKINPQLSDCPKLVGTDGLKKMSKSLGNAIYLKDSPDTIIRKIRKMRSDPEHIYIENPGKLEGNTVFEYLDIFYHDKENLLKLKNHYTKGGLSDGKIKDILAETLIEYLRPIRERREKLQKDRSYLNSVLRNGRERAREVTSKTLSEVRNAIGLASSQE